MSDRNYSSPYLTDRLSDRLVTVLEPVEGDFRNLRRIVVREISVCEWLGRVVSHVCELPDGTRVKVPTGLVADCPRNVVLLRAR